MAQAEGQPSGVIAIRSTIYCDVLADQTPPDDKFIFGPPLPPSILPYILLSPSLTVLYQDETVMQGANALAYVNSLVVYATVACQYLLDPTDSPSNHLAQLGELAQRVRNEAQHVENKGHLKHIFKSNRTLMGLPNRNPPSVSSDRKVDWSHECFTRHTRGQIELGGSVFARLLV